MSSHPYWLRHHAVFLMKILNTNILIYQMMTSQVLVARRWSEPAANRPFWTVKQHQLIVSLSWTSTSNSIATLSKAYMASRKACQKRKAVDSKLANSWAPPWYEETNSSKLIVLKTCANLITSNCLGPQVTIIRSSHPTSRHFGIVILNSMIVQILAVFKTLMRETTLARTSSALITSGNIWRTGMKQKKLLESSRYHQTHKFKDRVQI